jgi:hypothetical protein
MFKEFVVVDTRTTHLIDTDFTHLLSLAEKEQDWSFVLVKVYEQRQLNVAFNICVFTINGL